MGPHGEEGEGPLDEGECEDVGRQLDVEMGREVDGLEGVACTSDRQTTSGGV